MTRDEARARAGQDAMTIWKLGLMGSLLYAAAMMPSSDALAVDVRPGIWGLTRSVERDGRITVLPAQSRCISALAAANSREGAEFISNLGGFRSLETRLGPGACKVVDAKNAATLLNWTFVCKGKAVVRQEGRLIADGPEHFTMQVRTQMTTGDQWLASTITAEGRYKGECPQ